MDAAASRRRIALRVGADRLVAAVLISLLIALVSGRPAALAGEEEVEERSMSGFSWVSAGLLAALPRPGGSRPLDDDLDFLAGEGVTLLVSLTEEPIDPRALERRGIRLLHLPVADFSAPTLDQLRRFVEAVEAAADDGERVAVHCAAGLGRSGTFAAAWLVSRGRTADEAITEIRRLRPGSVETEAQERRLAEFAAER